MGILYNSLPGGSVVKNLPANAGDRSSTPGLGRSPGQGNGNPLCILAWRIPMDRGALWAICSMGHKESHMTECISIAQYILSIKNINSGSFLFSSYFSGFDVRIMLAS